MSPSLQTPRTPENAEPYRRTLRATAQAAHGFRRHFTEWVESTVATDREQRSDIVLAVYEAVANAVEHAYLDEGATGEITVDGRRDSRNALTVTVTDVGSWKPFEPSAMRGRGIPLIGALSDEHDILTDSRGTTVTVRWRLSPTQ
ncbi:ATP-binding protein [Gordonia sp. OPL2]|uniref:ATP-binding protein n=1 Tax=Gordonia sp. OPL2 TaxID=2486274 RepID=UPI0021CC61DB|nr:ATP-binding protein [Gordonia sp. OPL2]